MAMETIIRTYNLNEVADSGFFNVVGALSTDCGCGDGNGNGNGDGGGGETDDCVGYRKDPDGIVVESFCPDLILVASADGGVVFSVGSDITLGTDTLECVDGIHEATKTLTDAGQYFFEVIEVFTNMDLRAFDYTVCACTCDEGNSLSRGFEMRFIEAFLEYNTTYNVQVTAKSCGTEFVLSFDVHVPVFPIP